MIILAEMSTPVILLTVSGRLPMMSSTSPVILANILLQKTVGILLISEDRNRWHRSQPMIAQYLDGSGPMRVLHSGGNPEIFPHLLAPMAPSPEAIMVILLA